MSCYLVLIGYLAISRHAFLLWLVFREAFVTKDQMCWWGFAGNTLCKVLFWWAGIHCSSLLSLQFLQKSLEASDDFMFDYKSMY